MDGAESELLLFLTLLCFPEIPANAIYQFLTTTKGKLSKPPVIEYKCHTGYLVRKQGWFLAVPPSSSKDQIIELMQKKIDTYIYMQKLRSIDNKDVWINIALISPAANPVPMSMPTCCVEQRKTKSYPGAHGAARRRLLRRELLRSGFMGPFYLERR